jgi:type IV pilus assembly protein PilE
MTQPRPRPDRGFSLLELMLAVAIIGVLAAIALPSYGDYVLRSNRTVAKTVIMRIVGQQESHFSDRKQYASTLPILNSADYGAATTVYVKRDGAVQATNTSDTIYAVTLTDASATAYSVQAAPVNAQAKDTRCGTLTYSSAGARTASGSATDCWVR